MFNLRSLALPAMVAVAVGLAAGTAMAQSASPPLNLKLPPGTASSVPAAASTISSAAAPVTARSLPALPPGANEFPPPARSSGAAMTHDSDASPAPGIYYGDHSNTTAAGYAEQTASRCDDYSYNKPQIHGSVGTGIVTGSHIGTGNYSGGVATLSKAFGSCDDPEGGMSISIGGTTSHGFDRR